MTDRFLPFFPMFPKIGRLSREIVVTEKLDGTNASICITSEYFMTGSRTKWITPEDDNFGFARWAYDNKEELIAKLGCGHHYGEWWGGKIQRGYGIKEKRFSLFNTSRWADDAARPSCCSVVPILYTGLFDTKAVDLVLDVLKAYGSKAAPGFMQPEGVVVFHAQSNTLFKKTLEKDDAGKSHGA